MKKVISLLALVASTSGCLTSKPEKIVAAMGKDPSSLHVKVTTIYGVLEITRANPGTNTQSHSVNPDGTITVTAPGKPEPELFLVQEPDKAPRIVTRLPPMPAKSSPR